MLRCPACGYWDFNGLYCSACGYRAQEISTLSLRDIKMRLIKIEAVFGYPPAKLGEFYFIPTLIRIKAAKIETWVLAWANRMIILKERERNHED